ncbi:MAG: O-antigen ligase family protein [Desulfuromonadaceae bacterium]
MTERQEQIKYWVIQTCYFLTGALFLGIYTAHTYAPAVLLLISLPLIIKREVYSTLSRDNQLYLMISVTFVLVQYISILLDGGRIRDFDHPGRVLMGASLFILCLKYPPRFLWLMVGVSTGAIGAGIRAVWGCYFSGEVRAFEHQMNAIQGGDISMSLGLLSLCGAMWAVKKSYHLYTIFFTVAAGMGVIGSILSQSRGGWILLPVIPFIIYKICSDWFSKRLKTGLLCIYCLLIIFCLTPQSSIPQRFAIAGQDITLYFSGGTKDTSIGKRIENWKSALDSFVQKPLFGWGKHGVLKSREQQLLNGSLGKAAHEYADAHSQYLDELAKRGIIGFAALLALFLYPLNIFIKGLKFHEQPESRAFAASGIILVLSTMGYCVTQSFLNHYSGIIFYSVFVVYFVSAVSSKPENIRSPKL